MIDDARGSERRARRNLIRGALLTTPPFILFAALSAFNLIRAAEGNGGVWIVTALTALITALFAATAVASLRDLFVDPVETSGAIVKSWKKADFFVLRRHYLQIEDEVFRVRKDQFRALPAVDHFVGVYHFPHTNTVIDWWPLREPQWTPAPPPLFSVGALAPPRPPQRAPHPAAPARAFPLSTPQPQQAPPPSPRPTPAADGLVPRPSEWTRSDRREPPTRADGPHRLP